MEEKERWLSLADMFAMQGDIKGMRAAAAKILEDSPGDLDALSVVAEATFYLGEYEAASRLIRQIRVREPEHLRALLVVAAGYAVDFVLDKEVESLQHILQLADRSGQPTAFVRRTVQKAQGWLADVQQLLGRSAEAMAAMLAASRLSDTLAERQELFSKGLFLSNYEMQPACLMRQLYAEYQQLFAGEKRYYPCRKQGSGTVGKKHHTIRVGYISPDFRQHAAAYFIAPLLRNFNKKDFAIYCYSLGKPDAVTKRFRRFPAVWRDLSGLPVHEAARLIHADGLDLLFDLAGHTQNNALPILACRPAPIQMSGIGYMNTTGLQEVDYFLSDAVCLPPQEHAHGFVEEIVRLPHSHLCYAPDFLRKMPQPALETPARRTGRITFGCFNQFAKASDETLQLWRAVLEALPEARLVLKAKICSVPSGRDEVKKRLMNFGIRWEQIELRAYSPDYLEQYQDIDIALDTTPYTGGLTTCEALYMGVPVITLRGRTHGARFGASILENAGLPELIAESDLEYVQKAVHLAGSLELLQSLHEGLRAQLEASPLMDAPGYMAELEQIYHSLVRAGADACIF